MSVRLLLFILLSSPVLIFASQADNKEQDLEMFEFLAMFDQKDNAYLDAEMDDVNKNNLQSEVTPTVTKSKSNE